MICCQMHQYEEGDASADDNSKGSRLREYAPYQKVPVAAYRLPAHSGNGQEQCGSEDVGRQQKRGHDEAYESPVIPKRHAV